MSSPVYEAVLLLLEQLTPEERRAVAARLIREEDMTPYVPDNGWLAAMKSLVIHTPVTGEFSDRREDWYGDDGR